VTIKMGNGMTIKYAAKLFLAVIIGLVMLGSLPAPVQAAEPIDLVLGGEGATSWSIGNIMPCDSGTKTVTLQNTGYLDGFVVIWISDIESGEGLNPEPETDKEGPGELDDYLLFDLSTSPGVSIDTDISLPATINDFPPSVDGPGYIWLTPLNAGDTITLYWEWELPCETGNDVQGDTLSFTINYFLVDDFPKPKPPPTPPPPGGPGGGGGGGTPACYIEIDTLSEITMVRVGCCTNKAIGYYMAFDPDDIHFLEIKHDMELICGDCAGCRCYPQVVVMSLSEKKPSPPEGMAIVGPVYDFTGYKDLDRTIPCKLATYFDPPAIMQISYDPDDLPEGAFEPVIGFYDDELGLWITLPTDTGRVAEVGKVTGVIAYLASPFAVLVNVPPPSPSSPPPPPAPASFVVSGLNIEPSVREIWQPVTFMTKTGESVTITADVANDGGQEGTYTVELKISGEIIDSEVVTLDAGQSEQVSFTLSGMDPGQYEVEVSGLSGEFTVQRTLNWWLIGGIIAALLILLGWLIWHYRKNLWHYMKNIRYYLEKLWYYIKKLWYYIKKLWYYRKKLWYYRKKIRPATILRVFRFSHS